jgi:DNA repair protein RecN (Recombination protein N)
MLKEVSRCHQVLCITHLASIASYADAHFRVSKSVVNDRTQSKITLLNESERVEEIARMLGGTSITAKTLDHAAEMISQARESFTPKPL